MCARARFIVWLCLVAAALLIASTLARAQADPLGQPIDALSKRHNEVERWSMVPPRYCNIWYSRSTDRYAIWIVSIVAFDGLQLGTQAATDIITAARANDWPKLTAARTATIDAPVLRDALAPCVAEFPATPPGPWIATPSSNLALDAPVYPVDAAGKRGTTPLPSVRALRGLRCACEKLVVAPATAGGSTYCPLAIYTAKTPTGLERAVTRCTEVKP